MARNTGSSSARSSRGVGLGVYFPIMSHCSYSFQRTSRRFPSTVVGILYPVHGTRSIQQNFTVNNAAQAGHLPEVNVQAIFHTIDPLHAIHRTVVKIHRHRFLVYGYYTPAIDVSESITAIAPSTVWRGEVAVLALGNTVPLYHRPCVKRSIINQAAAL